MKEFLIALFILEFYLISCFAILDISLLFIFFETATLGLFFIIQKKKPSFYALSFFLSPFSILYIYYQIGTTDYTIVLSSSFTKIEKKSMLFCFFIFTFIRIVKTPILFLCKNINVIGIVPMIIN